MPVAALRGAVPIVVVALLAFGARSPAVLEAGPEASGSADLVELGRRLFHDPAASASGRSACASCHRPEHGFSDPAAFSFDEGAFTPRHSQSLVDLDLARPLHWDGSVGLLEDAVAARVLPPSQRAGSGSRRGARGASRNAYYGKGEGVFVRIQSARARETLLPQDRPTAESDLGPNFIVVAPELEQGSVTVRLQGSRRYRHTHPQLGDASGDPSEKLVVEAITAYVASLRSETSPIDRVMAGEALVLPAAAERGLDLFRGRAGCATCHSLTLEGGRVLLRDGDFHNTGVSWLSKSEGGAQVEDVLLKGPPRSIPQGRIARAPTSGDRSAIDSDRLRRAWEAIRKSVTGDPGRERRRRFKTPSLRDVARRPPYMHDGSLATLADVVRHYASGCGDDPERDRRLKGFRADERDVDDLVAFLEALSGPDRPGLAQLPWKERVERVRLTVVDAKGQPLPNLDLELRPVGELASKSGGADGLTRVRTDAEGKAEAPFGSRTHLRVGLPGGIRPLGGDLIPDTCQEAVLELPVSGRVRFTVLLEDGVEAPLALRAYRCAELQDSSTLTAAAAAALANGIPIFEALEVVAVDPDPWTLQRVALETRAPRGAFPGVPADVLATYEAFVPTSRSAAWVRFPGEWAARKLDLADAASLR